MTNREFIQNLSTEELAEFLTDGLTVKYKNVNEIEPFCFTLVDVLKTNVGTKVGMENWLNQECLFEVVR